jgi:hypothetical protein
LIAYDSVNYPIQGIYYLLILNRVRSRDEDIRRNQATWKDKQRLRSQIFKPSILVNIYRNWRYLFRKTNKCSWNNEVNWIRALWLGNYIQSFFIIIWEQKSNIQFEKCFSVVGWK